MTGLGMLGYQDLNRALEVRPRHIRHVDETVFDRLEAAQAAGDHNSEFETAWANGYAFARSEIGLRGRPPWTIEWKGHHKPASKGIETIPADLRIDHVYLISCKYGSRILHNSSPIQLFENCLSGAGTRKRTHWYEHTSERPFRAVWKPVYDAVGLSNTATPSSIEKLDRVKLKEHLKREPIDTTTDTYRSFVNDVSITSAAIWKQSINQPKAKSQSLKSELFWRLLRMQAAPYFVLGADSAGQPVRYRVATPWDFQQKFTVKSFDVTPRPAGQPTVNWSAEIGDDSSAIHRVEGHVEIRWSHGKLGGLPEAKVYLDTPVTAIPGYESL